VGVAVVGTPAVAEVEAAVDTQAAAVEATTSAFRDAEFLCA